ncbi:MAG: CHAT domain-containing protein [Pyrinomonadaceae bacterium]|nr:CHAT domain-containing protein [Pyrinomonadaceae bacterium]
MSAEKQMAQMDWSAVRQVLRGSKPKTRGTLDSEVDPPEQILRTYFGDENFRELRDLTHRAAETKKELGNVVLLPGIMGSHLSVVEADGDADHVWISLWRILKGDMKRLKLSADGKTNVNSEAVKATGLIGWYYARALETLQAAPFPYDWRLNVCDTADELAEFVGEKLTDGTFDKNKPVHFVAHSMGGLVVRNFIRQHRDLWNEIKGRLVMLGTPNSGSFAAVQTLMGKSSFVKTIAAALPFQSQADWFQVIDTFPGLYQLCPSKLINPEIYEPNIWDKFPDVSFAGHLQLIPKFHQDLFDTRDATVDKLRMAYIAGVGYATPSALKILDGDGGFDFDTTLDGDGTVPHLLGLLEDVPTYYVEEAHGDLPNNRAVLQAVKDILQNKQPELPTVKPVVLRSRTLRSAADDDRDFEQIEAVARLMRENQPLETEVIFDAEKKILRSLLGGSLGAKEPVSFLSEEEKTLKPKKLRVELMQGYLENAEMPLVFVGHYHNLPPTSACGAIDAAIGYQITYAQQNGMFGAQLGQLFTIPLESNVLNKKVKAVMVGGMGDYDSFSRDDLRYLVMNVSLGALALGYEGLAMVLVGTGSGRISIDRAVRSILSGVSDALERQPKGKNPPLKLALVENKTTRISQIEAALNQIEKENSIKGLDVEVSKTKSKAGKPKSKARPFFVPSDDQREVTRITIERQPELFCLSALTSSAAIPMREIPVQDFVINCLIEKLRSAQTVRDQQKYGRLLHAMVIPEDFQRFIDTNRSLVLILNTAAAAIPWEMVGFGGVSGTTNFGIDLRVTRQFASLSAAVPSVAPPVNNRLKVLVIADPAEEEKLRLPGARKEGESLLKFFTQMRESLKGKIDFQFETRIGHEQCDLVEILSLIFEEEFDIVHFAGHGIFDKDNQTNNGWVFGLDETNGKLKVLSAREIFRLRRVPRLVFANACFSSQIGTTEIDKPLSARETNRKLAGLAQAFFEQGIENYVGAGWQVDDAYAIEFARKFYAVTLAEGKSLGEALSDARSAVATLEPTSSTWGAYQHYGDANTLFVR